MGDDTSWESSGFGAWTGFWSDGDGKSLNAGCGVRNEEYEYTECNTCVSLQSSNAVRLESQAGRKTIQPENCIVIVPDMHSLTYASALVAHRVGGGITPAVLPWPAASVRFAVAHDTLAVRLEVPVIKASIGTLTRLVTIRFAFATRISSGDRSGLRWDYGSI